MCLKLSLVLYIYTYGGFSFMIRQQGSWNFLKAGITLGRTLMLWLMHWQLLNIMMLLVVRKDNMLLLIMHFGFQ